MAKRKLSPEKRAELRAYLKKSIGGEQKTADVLREVAKKYGITTITARWYLKSVDGSKKAGRRGPGRPRGRKPGRPAGSNGSISGFIKKIQAQAENANEANKLVPRWQALVDKESSLRRHALKLERSLDITAKKASQLRRRINDLVRS
jgi:hypothetical protein